MRPNNPALPMILAFVAAALWGLWWIPIRWLQSYGLDGALGGLIMMTSALAVSLGLLVLRPSQARLPRRVWLGAVLIGIAFSAYSAAFNYSEVVRVILLFYLAPVWSKIIERVFLNLPWRWTSTVALFAALAGALLLLGPGLFEGQLRSGDIIALFSGLFWSAGAALIFTSRVSAPIGLMAVCSVFIFLSSIGFVVIAGTPLPGAEAAPVIVPALALGVVYLFPVLFLTLWSAERLAPATMSFLLTAELLTGVISGALWLDEPFGWVQGAGAALILSAALVEVLFRAPPDHALT